MHQLAVLFMLLDQQDRSVGVLHFERVHVLVNLSSLLNGLVEVEVVVAGPEGAHCVLHEQLGVVIQENRGFAFLFVFGRGADHGKCKNGCHKY